MGIKVNNLSNSNRKVVNQLGAFSVIEYEKDSSVNIGNAQVEYFMGKMGVRRRQVLVNLNNSAVTVQAGSMQWMAGPIAPTKSLFDSTSTMAGKAAAVKSNTFGK